MRVVFVLSRTTQRDLSAVRVRLSRLPSPRSSRALAQRIWAEKPACNRQTLSQVSLESAFASALTRLFPNSGENTAKDLVHIIKMPLKCFSTKISESRRAGENPLPGQLGWGERLGSLSLLPSRGPGRGGVGGHRHLSWSRASSAKGNCRKWGQDGYAGIFFPAISSSHPSVWGMLCAHFLQAGCRGFCMLRSSSRETHWWDSKTEGEKK